MKKSAAALLNRIREFVGLHRFVLCIIVLMGFCGAFWGTLCATYGLLNPLTTFFIASLGWPVVILSLGLMLNLHSKNGLQVLKAKVETMEMYNDQLRHARDAINRAYGYDEMLDKKISIYSKLVRSVGTGTGNALVNFVITTNPDDTVFLIRVNHGLEAWHFQVAGRPIHIDQAMAIMLAACAKIEAMAGPANIIQKKTQVQN